MNAPEVARPVFVLGPLRSGANLVALAIGSHPRFAPPVDTGWLDALAVSLRQTFASAQEPAETAHLAVAGIEIEQFYERFGATADRLIRDSLRGHPPRWVDSLTDRTAHGFGLVRLFPNARFVHVVRPPEEVVTALTDPAQRAQYRGKHVSMTDAQAFRHWHDTVVSGLELERAFGSTVVLRLTRADVTAQPETSLRRVFDFLGESFDQRCLRVTRDLVPAAPPMDDVVRTAFINKRCPRALQASVLARAEEALAPAGHCEPDALLEAALEARFSAYAGGQNSPVVTSPPARRSLRDLVRVPRRRHSSVR